MFSLISKLKSNAVVIMGSLIGFLYVALNLSRRKTAKVKSKLESAERSAAAEAAKNESSSDIRESVDNQIAENIAAEIERNEIPKTERRSGRFGSSKRLF